MRVVHWLGAVTAGSVAGMIAFIATFAAEDMILGYGGPVQARIDSHGLEFLANVAWLAGIPALVAACVAFLVVAVPNIQWPRFVAAVCIGGIVGCFVSVLTWSTLTGDFQGPNPILFAGQVTAAFAAVTVTVTSPQRGSG
jgi:hypothetical protein